MKDKIIKSYVLLGNLPIYSLSSSGITCPEGCEFVINSRVKYELGVCSLQFVKQNHPSVYSIDAQGFNPEIELDISSLIRFKKLLEYREDLCNPINENNNGYVLLSSTKLSKLLDYQKPAFVNTSLNAVNIIIETNKVQDKFTINGKFQIECFIEVLEVLINQLSNAIVNYDITKSYSDNKILSAPSTTPYIYPGNVQPIPNQYPRVGDMPPFTGPTCNSQSIPPAPITTTIIPQAPAIN